MVETSEHQIQSCGLPSFCFESNRNTISDTDALTTRLLIACSRVTCLLYSGTSSLEKDPYLLGTPLN